MIRHRCGELSAHNTRLDRSIRRLKHPNSTVGPHPRPRNTHDRSSSRAAHAEIRPSPRQAAPSGEALVRRDGFVLAVGTESVGGQQVDPEGGIGR